MNERVQALRELSVTTQPHIDMERAKSETATYKKYEGQLSVPELRAQVLYDYFATKTWYVPRYDNVDALLNDYEWANLEVIMRLEDERY